MVAGHMATDDLDNLVVAVPTGHKPALASDQLRHRASRTFSRTSVLPQCWRDLGIVAAPAAHPDLRPARRRARRPTPGVPSSRPPGPDAARLPDRQPPPPGS